MKLTTLSLFYQLNILYMLYTQSKYRVSGSRARVRWQLFHFSPWII